MAFHCCILRWSSLLLEERETSGKLQCVCAPRGGGGFWRRTEEVAKHTRAVQALVVAGTLPQFWGCFRTKKGEAGEGEGEKNKGSESYLCFR